MATADFSAFLAMGGYAAFVWPAYLMAVAILGGLSVQSWWRYRESVRMLDKLQQAGRPRR
jgi:heme exporter protein D